MAFVLNVKVQGVEYRGCQSGISSQTGKPWMSAIFEDGDCNQINVSVPAELQGSFYSFGLAKGDVCDVKIRAVARADGNSYITLQELPEMADVVSEVDY